MLTDPSNFIALHLRWFIAFLIALASASGWYYVEARDASRLPGGASFPGLVLGIVAGLLIVFECALWLRRTKLFRTRRTLGSAQLWMKAHTWLGLLIAPLALLHSGFAFGGTFTTLLMCVLLIVIFSGIFGLWMQNVVPRWLLEHVPGETVFSQIGLVQRQYADEAARIMYLTCGQISQGSAGNEHAWATDDAGDQLAPSKVVGARRRIGGTIVRTPQGGESQRLPNIQVVLQAYDQVIRPYLENRTEVERPLASHRRSRDYFASLRANAGEEAKATVDALEHLCDQSRDLNLQRKLHSLLHVWLVVHLPLSFSLFLLLLVHIFYALRTG